MWGEERGGRGEGERRERGRREEGEERGGREEGEERGGREEGERRERGGRGEKRDDTLSNRTTRPLGSSATMAIDNMGGFISMQLCMYLHR